MGTIRTLMVAGAALLAGFLSTHPAAHAQSKAAGAPLSLAPPSLQAKKPAATRLTKARKPIRIAKRRAVAPVMAQGGDQDFDTVMHGDDSVGLIARLPWWRADPWEAIRRREKAQASQVLTIAEAWAGPGAEPIKVKTAAAPAATAGEVADDGLAASALADPSELNTTGLGAANQGGQRIWLRGLIAMVGGALAAAAVGLLLFLRRRPADPVEI
jgi:hypothetical protein